MNPIRLPLLLAAALLAMPAQAQEADFGDKIATGKWLLTYQRAAEYKPLGLKKKDSGTSLTCMDDDPWEEIVAWVTSKGCSIDSKTLSKGVYRLEGQCRLKWMKRHPVPVSVEMRPETASRFRLDIQSLENDMLDFSEHTVATFQGPCPPDQKKREASAVQAD